MTRHTQQGGSPMSRKTPTTRDLRGRTVFTRSETHDLPPQDADANPWDQLLPEDESWSRRPHRRIKSDWLTLAVLLGVCTLAIAAAIILF